MKEIGRVQEEEDGDDDVHGHYVAKYKWFCRNYATHFHPHGLSWKHTPPTPPTKMVKQTGGSEICWIPTGEKVRSFYPPEKAITPRQIVDFASRLLSFDPDGPDGDIIHIFIDQLTKNSKCRLSIAFSSCGFHSSRVFLDYSKREDFSPRHATRASTSPCWRISHINMSAVSHTRIRTSSVLVHAPDATAMNAPSWTSSSSTEL